MWSVDNDNEGLPSRRLGPRPPPRRPPQTGKLIGIKVNGSASCSTECILCDLIQDTSHNMTVSAQQPNSLCLPNNLSQGIFPHFGVRQGLRNLGNMVSFFSYLAPSLTHFEKLLVHYEKCGIFPTNSIYSSVKFFNISHFIPNFELSMKSCFF